MSQKYFKITRLVLYLFFSTLEKHKKPKLKFSIIIIIIIIIVKKEKEWFFLSFLISENLLSRDIMLTRITNFFANIFVTQILSNRADSIDMN